MKLAISYETLNKCSIIAAIDDDDDNYYDPDYYLDNEIDRQDSMEDTWDAMTDGQYGDMPEDFDGDYSFLGY